MLFNKKANLPFEDKIRAVATYLQNDQSLRKIAQTLGISHPTLWHWVRRYKKEGEEGLKEKKLHKKRLAKNIETKVMLLKERYPFLTIIKAQQLMHSAGIKISEKGIWQIWKRYGLSKRSIQTPLSPFGTPNSETIDGLMRTKDLLQLGKTKDAAKILNDLPCLSEDPILNEIPENFLSPRRKLDRLYLGFGKIPFPEYLKNTRRIKRLLENKGYFYSSIITSFLELQILDWLANPKEQIKILRRLHDRMRKIKDGVLKFHYFYERAAAYCKLLQIKKAFNDVERCRKLIYFLSSPYFWENYGDLLTYIGKDKSACYFYKKAFEKETNQEAVARLALKIARRGYGMAGEYAECKKLLTKAETTRVSAGFGALYALTRAYLSFGQGNLDEALQFFLESMKKCEKEKLHNFLYAVSSGLATIAMALGKKNEAKFHLQKYLPLMKKYRLKPEELILRCLLYSVTSISKKFILISPLYLLNLLIQAKLTMKTANYQRARRYAQRQGLMGLFHRWVIFFSEPILYLLEKGRQVGLPRAILKFPIFNQKMSVYHIKFLGNLVIFKNQQYLKTKLRPREKALLIHFTLRIKEPHRTMPIKDILKNFWPKSINPSSLLSHLLVQLKRKMRLPGYLITINTRYPEPVLVNRGIYLTTDYNDFEISLAQAKALERTGEWGFARKEYLRAFKLFRGEPFRKMYDQWSEDMRHRILTQLETETVNFAKSCLVQNNKWDAKKVLEKILKIIPDSEEIKNLLNGNRTNG